MMGDWWSKDWKKVHNVRQKSVWRGWAERELSADVWVMQRHFPANQSSICSSWYFRILHSFTYGTGIGLSKSAKNPAGVLENFEFREKHRHLKISAWLGDGFASQVPMTPLDDDGVFPSAWIPLLSPWKKRIAISLSSFNHQLAMNLQYLASLQNSPWQCGYQSSLKPAVSAGTRCQHDLREGLDMRINHHLWMPPAFFRWNHQYLWINGIHTNTDLYSVGVNIQSIYTLKVFRKEKSRDFSLANFFLFLLFYITVAVGKEEKQDGHPALPVTISRL